MSELLDQLIDDEDWMAKFCWGCNKRLQCDGDPRYDVCCRQALLDDIEAAVERAVAMEYAGAVA